MVGGNKLRMTIRFQIDKLPIYAATRRDGFSDAVLGYAVVRDGLLEIESEHWQRLTQEYLKAHKPFGLGDAVASVAQPIAGILDSVLGTHIQGCGDCAQRRDALNRIIPDLKP